MEYEQNDLPDGRSSSNIFLYFFFGHVSFGCGIFLRVKLCQPNPHHPDHRAKNGFSKKPTNRKRVVVDSLISLDSFSATIETSDPNLETMICFDVCLEPEWWKLFENLQKQANMSCWWSCFWLRSMKPCTDAMFFLKHFSSCGVPLPLQETSTFTTKVTKVSLMYPDANAWWMNALFSLCLHSIPGELNNNFLMSLFSSSRCIYIYII